MTPDGDALERLCDDHRQLDELFDTFAQRERDGGYDADAAQRLAELICTLLRVHDALEESVLEPALRREFGAHPVLDRAVAQRIGLREAMDRLEALSPHDPRYGQEVSELAHSSRERFALHESQLFELARSSSVDLLAIDAELGRRQERLLSAGRAAM